ncbi:hypothetical protein NMG60_11023289 [Bertholletia excelsa]
MGSEWNPRKSHYDISMSRRTRKPLNLEKEADEGEDGEEGRIPKERGDSDHKSLKQLMVKERSTLDAHFTEEKQRLQVVVKQHEEDLDGVNFKRLVSRYSRVLRRLIKVKREPHLGSGKKRSSDCPQFLHFAYVNIFSHM